MTFEYPRVTITPCSVWRYKGADIRIRIISVDPRSGTVSFSTIDGDDITSETVSVMSFSELRKYYFLCPYHTSTTVKM